MNIWRPQQYIQVKALGLVWQNGLLLAGEVYNDDGSVKGVRPLGGRIEFGENWQDALVREFQEELGVTISISGTPIILENIFTHQGQIGHEIAFVSPVIFPDGAYENSDPITYYEDQGQKCRANWYDINSLDCGGLALYPTGLKAQLLTPP